MKNNSKDAVIFLTTKKGTEKGTKDIYMVNEYGDISEGAKGVTAIHLNEDFPKGVTAKNSETGTLFLNPVGITLDPLHPVQVLENFEDLETSDKEVAREFATMLTDSPEDFQDEEHKLGTLEDVLGTLKDLGNDVKCKAQGNLETLQDIIDRIKSGSKDVKTPQAPKASETLQGSATDIINEIGGMLKSGKIDDKRFRELIPEGSFLEFSKKLSEETKDPSFYNIAKVLMAINPKY